MTDWRSANDLFDDEAASFADPERERITHPAPAERTQAERTEARKLSKERPTCWICGRLVRIFYVTRGSRTVKVSWTPRGVSLQTPICADCTDAASPRGVVEAAVKLAKRMTHGARPSAPSPGSKIRRQSIQPSSPTQTELPIE